MKMIMFTVFAFCLYLFTWQVFLAILRNVSLKSQWPELWWQKSVQGSRETHYRPQAAGRPPQERAEREPAWTGLELYSKQPHRWVIPGLLRCIKTHAVLLRYGCPHFIKKSIWSTGEKNRIHELMWFTSPQILTLYLQQLPWLPSIHFNLFWFHWILRRKHMKCLSVARSILMAFIASHIFNCIKWHLKSVWQPFLT